MQTETTKLINDYLDYLLIERALSKTTRVNYLRDLRAFFAFSPEKELSLFTKDDIMNFIKDESGQGKNSRTINRHLSTIKGFFNYLKKERIIKEMNLKIDALKTEKRLPQYLAVEDIELLLNFPVSEDSFNDVRTRAMFEVMYATGVRVSELLNLKSSDINFISDYLSIIGKGNKERLLPLGSYAKEALMTYLELRNNQHPFPKVPTVFISRIGAPLTRQYFFKTIKTIAKNVGITAHISPHSLRHAFATHLLEGGASLKVVQELMGHQSIGTTQIYLSVNSKRILAIYDRTMKR